ncbi:MAG TPA: hypothetical protein VJ571_02790 [Candidatus Nitrosotalea sp.]|nr:hypothetical protein [Candidatus Nitrosotalea sp.]
MDLYEDFVNESVKVFNDRIFRLVKLLHETSLTVEERTALEDEKLIVIDQRTHWKEEQFKLKNKPK